MSSSSSFHIGWRFSQPYSLRLLDPYMHFLFSHHQNFVHMRITATTLQQNAISENMQENSKQNRKKITKYKNAQKILRTKQNLQAFLNKHWLLICQRNIGESQGKSSKQWTCHKTCSLSLGPYNTQVSEPVTADPCLLPDE